MKNKFLIGLGAISTIALPIAVISCSCSSKSKTETPTSEKPIIEMEKEKQDNLKYEFANSKVSIKDNTALVDLTADATGEVKDNSWWLTSYLEALENADTDYPELLKPFIDWAKTKAINYPFVKIAYRFYYHGDLIIIVHKWSIKADSEQLTTTKEIYTSGESIIDAFPLFGNNKRSTDFRDFLSDDW